MTMTEQKKWCGANNVGFKCDEMFTLIGAFSALQEYQDHPSDEEDGDLYDKIGSTDAARDDRFGSGPDKRRCRLRS